MWHPHASVPREWAAYPVDLEHYVKGMLASAVFGPGTSVRD